MYHDDNDTIHGIAMHYIHKVSQNILVPEIPAFEQYKIHPVYDILKLLPNMDLESDFGSCGNCSTTL
jgi:hypothetical protein